MSSDNIILMSNRNLPEKITQKVYVVELKCALTGKQLGYSVDDFATYEEALTKAKSVSKFKNAKNFKTRIFLTKRFPVKAVYSEKF